MLGSRRCGCWPIGPKIGGVKLFRITAATARVAGMCGLIEARHGALPPVRIAD